MVEKEASFLLSQACRPPWAETARAMSCRARTSAEGGAGIDAAARATKSRQTRPVVARPTMKLCRCVRLIPGTPAPRDGARGIDRGRPMKHRASLAAFQRDGRD